jgi:hypothetical protein
VTGSDRYATGYTNTTGGYITNNTVVGQTVSGNGYVTTGSGVRGGYVTGGSGVRGTTTYVTNGSNIKQSSYDTTTGYY